MVVEIKTKPATNKYRNGYDAIFRKEPMKRYRVPFDVFVYADSVDEVERKADGFMRMALKDVGPTFNVTSFIAPVGYPTEEEPLGTTT
jgi:hypothetical protein